MNVLDQPAANDPAADAAPPWQQEMHRALRAGIRGTVLGSVALSAWAALAPLAAAVIAEGTVKSAGNRKTVQHAEGGIVAAIHVKDGDRVTRGQPLITLADARVAAGAQALREQWAAGTLKAQRLGAETRGVPFVPDFHALEQPEDRASDSEAEKAHVALLARREQELFAARARQQSEQAQWLSEQLSQIQSEMKTQGELIATTESALGLARQDLAMNEKLKASGFITEARLVELQRVVADYRARVQAGQSQLSQARQKAADTRLKLSAQRTEFARAAADELKEVTTLLAQTNQALRPALDAQTRQQLAAPVDGEVVDLKVHTVGAAIGPREPLLDIVPAGSDLVIEARIVPTDIRDAQKAMAHGALAHVMLSVSSTDVNGSHPWAFIETHYEQGRVDWSSTSMDDGSRHWTDINQSDQPGWTHLTSRFDAAGREDYANLHLTGGGRLEYDYDQDGSQP